MMKIIFMASLLLSFASFGQVKQVYNQYGGVWNRLALKHNGGFQLPRTTLSTRDLNVALPDTGQVYYNPTDSSVYYHTGFQWVKFGAGNTFLDNAFTIQDDGDNSKQLQFQLSGIGTGTTRTLTIPDQSGTIALTTFSNAWGSGVRQTFTPSAARVGFNPGTMSGDPVSAINGDVFYDNGTHKYRGYINGVWTDFATGTLATPTLQQVVDAGNSITGNNINITNGALAIDGSGGGFIHLTQSDDGAAIEGGTDQIKINSVDDGSGFRIEWDDITGGVTPIVNLPNFTSGDYFALRGFVNLWGDGIKQTFNPNGTNAGINVGSHTADPSSPANGDLWYNSTSNELKGQINGVSVALGSGGGTNIYNSDGTIAGSRTVDGDGNDIFWDNFGDWDILIGVNSRLRLSTLGSNLVSPNGNGFTTTDADAIITLNDATNDSLMINDVNIVAKHVDDYVFVQRGSVGSKRVSKLTIADFLAGVGGGTTWNGITDPTGAQALTFQAGENSVWTDQNTTADNLTINSSTGTTNSLISLNRTGTALAAGNNIMELISSGANGTNAITATGLNISVTNTNGTSGTNKGITIATSGATTANHAIDIISGQLKMQSGTGSTPSIIFTNGAGIFDPTGTEIGIHGGTIERARIGQGGVLFREGAAVIDVGNVSLGGTNRWRISAPATGTFQLGMEATQQSMIFKGSNNAGSDVTGFNMTYQPGAGTGNSTLAGTHIFQTPDAGASGSTVQSYSTKFTVGRFGGLWASRNAEAQGADVASVAGAIALGNDGNAFEITGTNAITLISNVNWQNGAVVTFVFTSTASLTDGTANSGTDIGIELAGNANFVGSAGATITLRLLEVGGTQRWREVSRSVQ